MKVYMAGGKGCWMVGAPLRGGHVNIVAGPNEWVSQNEHAHPPSLTTHLPKVHCTSRVDWVVWGCQSVQRTLSLLIWKWGVQRCTFHIGEYVECLLGCSIVIHAFLVKISCEPFDVFVCFCVCTYTTEMCVTAQYCAVCCLITSGTSSQYHPASSYPESPPP